MSAFESYVGIDSALFHPCLEESDRKTAEIEGWILGVA